MGEKKEWKEEEKREREDEQRRDGGVKGKRKEVVV